MICEQKVCEIQFENIKEDLKEHKKRFEKLDELIDNLKESNIKTDMFKETIAKAIDRLTEKEKEQDDKIYELSKVINKPKDIWYKEIFKVENFWVFLSSLMGFILGKAWR